MDPFEAHLRRAEACFQAGDPRQAGQIWQAILKRDPAHAEAREGLIRVKAALAAAPPPPPVPAVPPAPPAPPMVSRDVLDTLLREASQLWDLGVPEDAIEKWQKVLDLDPQNSEARTFIDLVHKEQAQGAAPSAPPPPPPPLQPPPPQPAPPPAPISRPEPLPVASHPEDPRVAKAQHLLELNHHQEALFLFQQVLAQHPHHPQALEGLALAQKGAAHADPPTPAAQPPATRTPAPRPQPAVPATPVTLPATVTAVPTRRQGLDFPEPMRKLAAHPWLQSQGLWVLSIGLAFGAVVGMSFWRQASRDRQLKADVSQVIQTALIPVARATAVVNMEESTAAILAEAKSALADDPLRTYHRAKEVLQRSPEDGAAALLLEQARKALATAEPAPSGDVGTKVRAGDLDGALGLVLSQLRAAPDDPKLLRKAASLLGTLAQLQASQGKWGAAKIQLTRARALYPQDRAWSARLYLLERIQSQPKAEQAGWIALLW